ncbi:CDP-alcohol phosphatidyltransferase family protein [uncultured Bacteroides sp.]|uniref:CDP-alcohol phosphatidyltransferase family protein n=1 Tax=uncultured Bacteroides sp. TaxID=162156 RepID=UPI00261EB9EA|nr:CDP-alcohol phosphatidyltransferase family protein [uncultured Bacteroides sp.]
MKSYIDIVKEIKDLSKSRITDIRKGMLAGHMCRPLSPYLSAIFIQKGISPNMVTLMMIGWGILGSLLFAVPNIYCKIVGYVCFYLWFTMDLSDGEVARTTHKFSTYGKEMDYMAHLICHPLMNIAMWLTYLQANKYDEFMLACIFMTIISVELVMRNLISFDSYLGNTKRGGTQQNLPSYFRYLINQSVLYPNFILVFTLFTICDYIHDFAFQTVYLLLTWVTFFLLVTLKEYLARLTHYYKS